MPPICFKDPKKQHKQRVKDVQSLLKKLAKAGWNDNLEDLDIETLVQGLTLADKFSQQQLARLPWEQLLVNYGEVVKSKQNEYECQTYTIMYTALSIVAMRLGQCTEELVHKSMGILEFTNSVLRINRVAVPKLVKLLDVLAGEQSAQAYEIPMRRKALLSQASRLTDEHFQIIDQVLATTGTISIPAGMPFSAELRIPNMIYKLLCGRKRSRPPKDEASMKGIGVRGSEKPHLELKDVESILGARSKPLCGKLQGDPSEWVSALFCAADTMNDL